MTPHLKLSLVGLALVWGVVWSAEAGERVDFNRDVRPILSDTCFKCHGPDSAARKGDLALHTFADATGDRGGYAALVAGKPEASEAYKRLISEDKSERMPPVKSGMKLTPRQVETIRKWIEQGAEYQQHWAFIPPQRSELPGVKLNGWERNPIDRFILARLEKEGMKPSEEAPKETLIRRVSLDLSGLPPTVEEVEAFLKDTSPDAYEKVVDRLLASPHYGERMASIWLDAARYADTSGYQADWERHMWPWRDWVIRAFNSNMPFDRFTVEQLAGDMLPNATVDQRLATGFNRNHRINDEGGIIPEEYAVEYVVDRVDTTTQVWLGLTAGCARCHDHKYDPISQKEFYKLYAIFNNVPEKGQDGRAGFASPFMRVSTPEIVAEIEQLERKADEAEKKLASADVSARQAEWERSVREHLTKGHPSQWQVAEVERASASNGPVLQVGDDESVVANNISPETTAYTVVVKAERPTTAIKLDVLTHDSLPDGRLGRGDGNFFLSEVAIEVDGTPVKVIKALADYSQARHGVALAIDKKPGTGWAVDGDILRGSRSAVFVLERKVSGPVTVKLSQGSKKKQQTIGRFRIVLTDAQEPGIGTFEQIPAEVVEVVKKEGGRSEGEKKIVEEYFRSVDPGLAGLRKEAVSLRRSALEKADEGVPVMVMQEMARPRDTYLLKRGQYDLPDKSEKLKGGIPAVFDASAALTRGEKENSANAIGNRLGFARWLVSAENPLTARVAVNRYWQMYFGTGIVKTSEDFGAQGEWPSHPELLDWLATEFVKSGWDVKGMQKRIVTSAAYRQSSKVTRQLLEKDPDNRLLARGPRFRLDANGVRDNALAISGLLVKKVGGAPVKPYQPAGLWEELSFNDKTTIDAYKQDTGEDLYRRGIYTFWKRTSPPPGMAIFDAGGREACSVRTGRTNTPLQALNLLNDVTYVEAARAFGERMIKEGGKSATERLAWGWRVAMGREANYREMASLLKVFEKLKSKYESDESAAKALLSAGESKRDQSIDVKEDAAYAAIANVILNLDEVVTKE